MTSPNIADLARLMKENPEWGRHKLADALGISSDKVRHWVEKMRRGGTAQAAATEEDTAEEKFSFEQTDTGGQLFSRSTKIKTLEDLLEYADVDRNVWQVERFTLNKYEVGSKDADGNVTVTPLFQIKAWLKKLVSVERTRDCLKDILAELRKSAPSIPAVKKQRGSGNLLEVSIFDLHFGKLAWAQEAGQDYDARIAESVYNQAVEDLLARAANASVGRILLPVGNDFFNVDNTTGTTTAGTRQDEDGRWQRSFVLGRKMMVQAIERMREICPVDVVMVSGNHDTERLFYLGDVLDAWFSKAKDVSINNSPTMRKYYRWGKNLLGFTHGNNEKHKNLPLIMATEQPDMWAGTKFREFHVGHWHHKQEIHFQPVTEQNGIRVRIIPSLCPPDAWHRAKGYEGLRAAEAYLWDPEKGCVTQFSFCP